MKNFFKNILFPLFLAAFFAQNAAAQCPTGAATTLWTQTDIDSFPIKYPGCKKIEHLEIIQHFMHPGPLASDLTPLLGIDTVLGNLRVFVQNLNDLHGLDSVRFVGGNLNVWSGSGGSNFKSLAGLDNLEKVMGHVSVRDKLPKLKNLQGLEKLAEVGGEFEILNDQIETFDGLGSLRKVGGNRFEIRADSLRSLQGLGKLDTVVGNLKIWHPKHLKNFEGLKNFHHGGIWIVDADSLVNLKGLENWRSGIYLTMFGCPLLESLDGIENLQNLTGIASIVPNQKVYALWLELNPLLHDLSALDHPVSLGTGIWLVDNPNLSACSGQAICDYLTMPLGPLDTVVIKQNRTNCNSEAEVLSFCTTATDDFFEKMAFEIFPNPVIGNQPLQIRLENDFFGTVKFEILGLDGRVLDAFFEEKTDRRLNVGRVLNPSDVGDNAFFVRVSDGKTSATRLILHLRK